MHKEFMFKLQKIILSEDLTELLKVEKIRSSRLSNVNSSLLTFHNNFKSNNNGNNDISGITQLMNKDNNEISDTQSPFESKSKVVFTNNLLIENNNNTNTINTNSTGIINNPMRRHTINIRNPNNIVSRRFSNFLQLHSFKQVNQEEDFKNRMKQIDLKLEQGITVIENDINKQKDSFRKKLKEKQLKQRKNRKTSEEQTRLYKIGNLSLKHLSISNFNQNNRLSNVSSNSLTKKKFDEDDNEYSGIGGLRNSCTSNKKYKRINNSGHKRTVIENSSYSLRKISSNLFKSQGLFGRDTYDKKSFNKKAKKKNKLFNDQVNDIVVDLKNKLMENFQSKYDFLKKELEREYEAKKVKCQEGLESELEFEMLMQLAEGKFYY